MASTLNPTGTWALIAAACFVGGLVLNFIVEPAEAAPLPVPNFLAQLLFLGFHLALLPVVAALAAPVWARAAGYTWLVVDNVVVVMDINGVADSTTWPIRLGVHVAAATWILGVSFTTQHMPTRTLGALAGVWLGGYSVIAPYVNNDPLVFYPAAALLFLWLVVLVQTNRAPTPQPEPTAPTV